MGPNFILQAQHQTMSTSSLLQSKHRNIVNITSPFLSLKTPQNQFDSHFLHKALFNSLYFATLGLQQYGAFYTLTVNMFCLFDILARFSCSSSATVQARHLLHHLQVHIVHRWGFSSLKMALENRYPIFTSFSSISLPSSFSRPSRTHISS